MHPTDLVDIAQHHAVAGSAGSVVAGAMMAGEPINGRLVKVACGMLVAGYVTPLVASFVGVSSAPAVSALAFLLGLFGLALVAQIMRAISELRGSEALQSWLTRR